MYQYGGWSNMRMQTPQFQQNLPPGWEAKWDPGNRRWFFVDHSTKTTHWELPAATNPSPAPQRVTTSFITADPAKAKTLISEYEGLEEEYVRSLLRIYQNNMTSVRHTLGSKGYKKKTLVQPKPNFVSSLKNQYPTADQDIIKQALVSTNNNFVGARTALEAMGYRRKIEESVRATPKKTASKPKATKPAASSTSTSSDLSEATKRSRVEELKKKFPTVAESVIELALVGTMYDVKMASDILKSSIESVKTKSSSTIYSTSTSRPNKKPTEIKKTPERKSPERKPMDFAPVVFGADDSMGAYKPSIPVVSTIDVPPKASYTTPASGEFKKREYKPPPRKVYPRQTREPITGYKSENRSKAMGPDPTLVNGPDPSLLQTELIKAMGPNRSIRQGPQRSNRRGPIPSNAQGRAGIDVGPMHSRV